MCLIRMWFSLCLIFLNSLAWIMMSSAVPSMPASGWWIMIRELGSGVALALGAGGSSTAPIEAAWPMQ